MKVFSGSYTNKLSKNKVFEFKDVFIYVFLAIFIITLFLSLIVFNKTKASGFTVSIGDKVILSHVYGQKDFEKHPDWEKNIIITKNGSDYTIEILTENGGSNLIYCNEKDKTVKVIESNCPSGNCKHMGAISSSGAIYCAPRDLKILPLKDDGNLPPTTGGVS